MIVTILKVGACAVAAHALVDHVAPSFLEASPTSDPKVIAMLSEGAIAGAAAFLLFGSFKSAALVAGGIAGTRYVALANVGKVSGELVVGAGIVGTALVVR